MIRNLFWVRKLLMVSVRKIVYIKYLYLMDEIDICKCFIWLSNLYLM